MRPRIQREKGAVIWWESSNRAETVLILILTPMEKPEILLGVGLWSSQRVFEHWSKSNHKMRHSFLTAHPPSSAARDIPDPLTTLYSLPLLLSRGLNPPESFHVMLSWDSSAHPSQNIRPGLYSAIPNPSAEGGISLVLLNTIFFLSTLNLLSQALKVLPTGSPTQFYSLEALFQLTVLQGLRITAVPSAPCVR